VKNLDRRSNERWPFIIVYTLIGISMALVMVLFADMPYVLPTTIAVGFGLWTILRVYERISCPAR
jgi:uncharacterized membrane protein HdeD (DUF308 family)